MTDPEFPISPSELVPLMATALTRTAHEGARIVAMHWTHELLVARQDWDSEGDGTGPDEGGRAQRDAVEALHRSRVALRRLRAILREHRVTLGLNVGGRLRRSLRRLNKATNEARDRDVHREWLASERDSLPSAARGEADALLDELTGELAKGRVQVSRAFAREFDPHVERLAYRLGHFCAPRVVGQHGPVAPFAHHLADGIERESGYLQHDLGGVDDVGAQDVLHRIRIRLKRQRAWLAPFTKSHAAIGAWYAIATEGQDLLGAMRDAMLLSKLADKRNYSALSQSLHEVALAHFTAFHERWCGDSSAIQQAREAATRALRATADVPVASSSAAQQNGDDGLPPGHGLPMEIERKFLLHGLPPRAATAPSTRIDQGWLPGVALRERLRREVGTNERTKLTRTIKLGPIGARIELEEPTEPALFEALWPLTVNARIRKRRHRVPDGALTWEIDVFIDRDLVLAEIELSEVSQTVEIPDWLAPFIVREVTQEAAYLNSVMAQRDVAHAEPIAR